MGLGLCASPAHGSHPLGAGLTALQPPVSGPDAAPAQSRTVVTPEKLQTWCVAPCTPSSLSRAHASRTGTPGIGCLSHLQARLFTRHSRPRAPGVPVPHLCIRCPVPLSLSPNTVALARLPACCLLDTEGLRGRGDPV